MGGVSLGVDIGNVIINHRSVNHADSTLFDYRYSTIPATPDVYSSLKALNNGPFDGRIFLISKCTDTAECKILTWLKDNDFYGKTNINPKNVFFVKDRIGKAEVCIEHRITHFIDDRLEVLSAMIGKVPNLFLYQPDVE